MTLSLGGAVSPAGGRSVVHPYDEVKLGEVLLYAASRLEHDPAGGATKLNKVLFFAEFAHMREHGRPITGADYQKLQWGPAPRRLVPVRDRLIAEGAAELVSSDHGGRPQSRLRPLRAPMGAAIGATELKALDDAIDLLRDKTAIQVSNLSHEEWGWQAVADGETIPYESAILLPPAMTERVRLRAAELATELASR